MRVRRVRGRDAGGTEDLHYEIHIDLSRAPVGQPVPFELAAVVRFASLPAGLVGIVCGSGGDSVAAVQRAGKGRIRIIIDGARARPRVLFIDTGCGIAPQNLRNIFQRFYSSPAGNGAGIGLAFCKDVLDAWGAQIRCVSRLHYYTVFVLEFAPSQPNPQC